jgi:monovalent cation:H+ antiporter-2, CPA2 family
MTHTLQLVLVLLASAVFVVVVFRSLQLPPLLGHLLVGVAIGPHALGWIPETKETRYLAEFGVVFLMFSIGLEFSLAKLKQMRRVVFGLGGAQVLLSGAVFMAVFLASGEDWRAAVALAGVLAMSSTAIVVRMLAERRELETEHGRDAFGVLLFQDLAVVPLLVIIPALAGDAATLAGALGLAAAKAVIILTLLLVVGQRVMRAWFHTVAMRRSHELFIINVLFITLGLAYLTELAGLSLALGAFVAGMLISETEYRHQVEEDIKPFREVLLGLFFVTIGMQLDLGSVWNEIGLVLALFAAQVLVKFAIVAGLARAFGAGPPTAVRAGILLAQAGEFGLVLLTVATGANVVGDAIAQPVIASMLLSMFLAPFLINASDRIALRFTRSEWLLQSLALHRLAVRSIGTEQHVVICGYGRTGQALARFLGQEGIAYVALDLDPERVREAAAAGEPVVYGDASRREMLVAAGLARASAVVVTYADTQSALTVLHHVRAISPTIPAIVRTLDDADLDRLVAAGATEVVPETFESSLMLASHALMLLGVPVRRVVERIRTVREGRYALLRGFFHGESDEPADLDEASQPRLHAVTLAAGAHAIGRTLGELDVGQRRALVSAVRQHGTRLNAPPPELRLEEGDVVVLMGDAEAVAAGEILLLQGE